MRRIACRSLTVAFLLALHSYAQAPHVRKGLELFQQQHYEEALQEFEAARVASPGNPAIENALGIALTKLGRVAEANEHYQSAIRLDPKLADAHKNLGFNYLGARQYTLAEQESKMAIALAPQDPFAHFYLAMLYLATSRDKDAASEVQASWPVLGSDPAVSLRIAKACVQAGEIAKATSIVELLRKNGGLSPAQQREFAMSLFENSAYRQAAEQYRHLVAAEPNSWEDRYNLAVALLNSGQAAEATTILQPLAKERPHDIKILSVLGSVYEASRNVPQALKAYKAEAQSEPQEADHYLDYTRLLMDLNRFSEAEDFVQQGLKVVREPYALYLRLGSIRMMAGKMEEARTCFEKAIATHPEVPVGYVALAQSYFKERQDEKAAHILETARSRIGSDYLLEYYYGLALDRLDRKKEAAQMIEHALTLNPAIPDIHFELGRIYLDLNRVDSARAEFEKVIQMNPRHAKAYFQLSRIYARLGDSQKAHEYAQRTRQLKQDEREDAEAIGMSLGRMPAISPVRPN